MTLVLLAALHLLPVVGGMIGVLALVLGLGAWTRDASRRYATERPRAEPAREGLGSSGTRGAT